MDIQMKRIRKTMINTGLEKLNNLSAAQNMLVLLRSLNTSDLTFTYMLLEPTTVRDIVQTSLNLLIDDQTHEGTTLTPEEMKEFDGYIRNMESMYA